jgi:hypothetical protein
MSRADSIVIHDRISGREYAVQRTAIFHPSAGIPAANRAGNGSGSAQNRQEGTSGSPAEYSVSFRQRCLKSHSTASQGMADNLHQCGGSFLYRFRISGSTVSQTAVNVIGSHPDLMQK